MTAVDPHVSAQTGQVPTGAPASLRDVLAAYVGLTKPRIIELLLLTTVPVMFLAQRGIPPLGLVVATVVGGTLSAGSANALNCVYDADIDERMRRTRRRALPRHIVSARAALVFGLVLGVVSTVWLWVLVNPLSAGLALAANVFYLTMQMYYFFFLAVLILGRLLRLVTRLLPRTIRPRPKSRRNEPAHLVHVLRTVSACLGETEEKIAAATTATRICSYSLPMCLLKNTRFIRSQISVWSGKLFDRVVSSWCTWVSNAASQTSRRVSLAPSPWLQLQNTDRLRPWRLPTCGCARR